MGTLYGVGRLVRGLSELGPRQWIEHQVVKEVGMEVSASKGGTILSDYHTIPQTVFGLGYWAEAEYSFKSRGPGIPSSPNTLL